MDKIIKVLYEPPMEKFKWNRGLYKLLMQGDGSTYEAYVTVDEYELRVLKEKLYSEYHVSEKIIEKIVDLSSDITRRECNEDAAGIDI